MALRQYERCAALRARDLGINPMPETREVRRLIADGGLDEVQSMVAAPDGPGGEHP